MTFSTEVRGLREFQSLIDARDDVARFAVQAVNQATRDLRVDAAREIRQQINFPAGFVAPRNDRLAVIQKATPKEPVAIIRAAGRATSLSQFAVGSRARGRGVAVNITGSGVRRFQRAFIFRGRRISATTDARGGLVALRVRRGERLRASVAARQIDDGLYLLYGPSVAQVALSEDNTGVFRDLEEPGARLVERYFLRRLRSVGL